MSSAAQPQPGPAERWAGEMGEKWNTHLDRFEGMIAPLGEALIEAGRFHSGERVLDVGCGAGATTIEIARRVGPGGRAVGLDVSPTLVRTAQSRATKLGVENIRFALGDASKADIGESGFDCLFSRFGIMFFEEPYVAFAHLHGFLKPGGRLMVSCWGPPSENPWVTVAMDVAQRHVELPPPVPRAPGPFAFAEQDYFRDILVKSGFTAVTFMPWRGEQFVGGPGSDARSAALFLTEASSVGDALKNLPEAEKQKALAELEERFRPHEKAGSVRMGGMAWLVSATA